MYKLCIIVDTTVALAALKDQELTDTFRRYAKWN